MSSWARARSSPSRRRARATMPTALTSTSAPPTWSSTDPDGVRYRARPASRSRRPPRRSGPAGVDPRRVGDRCGPVRLPGVTLRRRRRTAVRGRPRQLPRPGPGRRDRRTTRSVRGPGLGARRVPHRPRHRRDPRPGLRRRSAATTGSTCSTSPGDRSAPSARSAPRPKGSTRRCPSPSTEPGTIYAVDSTADADQALPSGRSLRRGRRASRRRPPADRSRSTSEGRLWIADGVAGRVAVLAPDGCAGAVAPDDAARRTSRGASRHLPRRARRVRPRPRQRAGRLMDQGVGQLMHVAFTTSSRSGTLACNGSTASVAEWPELAELLGTTFGGDGTTTFGLPNLPRHYAMADRRGPARRSAAGSSPLLAEVRPMVMTPPAGSTVAATWLPCDGRMLRINQNFQATVRADGHDVRRRRPNHVRLPNLPPLADNISWWFAAQGQFPSLECDAVTPTFSGSHSIDAYLASIFQFAYDANSIAKVCGFALCRGQQIRVAPSRRCSRWSARSSAATGCNTFNLPNLPVAGQASRRRSSPTASSRAERDRSGARWRPVAIAWSRSQCCGAGHVVRPTRRGPAPRPSRRSVVEVAASVPAGGPPVAAIAAAPVVPTAAPVLTTVDRRSRDRAPSARRPPTASIVDRATQRAWLCGDGAVVGGDAESRRRGRCPIPAPIRCTPRTSTATSTLGGHDSRMTHFVAFSYGERTGARVAFHSVPTFPTGRSSSRSTPSASSVCAVRRAGASASCRRTRCGSGTGSPSATRSTSSADAAGGQAVAVASRAVRRCRTISRTRGISSRP